MNTIPEKYATRSTPTTPLEALAWIEELAKKLSQDHTTTVVKYLCEDWCYKKKQPVYAMHSKTEAFKKCEELCKEMNRSVDIMDRFRNH